MDNNIQDHSGHRKRLRNRFLSEGLSGLPDLQALELLLCFAIPRRDVMPLAEQLLAQFGSYPGVLQAPPDQLRQVKGISDNAVALILLMCQSMSRYGAFKPHLGRETRNHHEEQAIALFEGRVNEALYLMGLDENGQIIHIQFLGEQDREYLELPLRKIVASSITMDVNAVILVHNHPSGLLIPSEQDVNSTLALQNALNTLDIQLLEHYIVCNNRCLSVSDYILDNL